MQGLRGRVESGVSFLATLRGERNLIAEAEARRSVGRGRRGRPCAGHGAGRTAAVCRNKSKRAPRTSVGGSNKTKVNKVNVI